MNSKTLAAAAQAVINTNNIAMEGAFLEGSIRLRAEESRRRRIIGRSQELLKEFSGMTALLLECIKRDYLGITGNP
jgi:hypothetical protein